MRRESGQSSLGLLMIGMAAIFLAGFFLLVVFGAQSYRNTVAGQDLNNNARALQSYLSTAVRGSDRQNAVSVRTEGTYAPVLVIADGDSGYAVHIYRHEGRLLEDYAPLAAEPSPERSQFIGETALFEVKEAGGLLEVRTDAGRVLVHLRSGEGTA